MMPGFIVEFFADVEGVVFSLYAHVGNISDEK